MDEDLQNDPLDYADPVIVKVPLKTPDDALDYWNHRLETVSSERRVKSGGKFYLFNYSPYRSIETIFSSFRVIYHVITSVNGGDNGCRRLCHLALQWII